ncbi:MAG: 4Fe-4S dicluster domain-containing protein [Candidatus Omnitrophota bacterium]
MKMKYPKLREIKEALTSLFSKPYTSKFPYQPHTPEKRFRGKPEYYKEHCVGCTACAQVCPSGAIEWSDDIKSTPPVRRLVLRYDLCIFCGQCQANCITEKGIQLSQKFDLAGFSREDMKVTQENELVLCEGCGEVAGTKDHLRFIREKIGSLSLANEDNLLLLQEELGLSPGLKGKIDLSLKRSDLFRVLCPKCRRDIHLSDEWNLK